ncbi:unnamed protein product [Parajaminaea phylloscopi]
MSDSPIKEGKGSPLGVTSSLPHDEKDINMHEASALAVTQPSKITNRCLLLMFTICAGGFLFGYDIGVISGCLIMKDFVQRFGGDQLANGSWELPPNTQSLITSLLGAGTFFGALAQAPISDWIGRQKSMVFWAIIFSVGAVIQTATERALAQMIVGRFVAGLAVGALSGLCPLYLGETAPKAIRGTMVSGYQLLIISGIVVSYAVSWGSHNAVNSSASWRIPVGLQLLWGLLLIVLMVFLPESPRWELQRGNAEKARSTMAAMRGITLANTPQGLRGDVIMEGELEEMAAFIEAERSTFAGTNFFTAYLKCFAMDKQLWRRTLAGMLLQTFQQLNGQNFYYYYGATFFSKAQVSLNPYEVQFILGIVSWVATWPALYLIEKFGRRSSLLVGSVICAVSAVIVAFVGHDGLAKDTTVKPTSGEKMAGNAFIAFAVIHLVGFSTFWGPVPWVYLSESFPQNVRAKCISLGSSTNWFWNFMLGYFSPKIAADLGPYIMLIFFGLLCCSFIYVFFFIPETKGLSLEQVDEMYESGAANKPWKTYRPPVAPAQDRLASLA